jgi:pimeloyl-ACP methyl ester carboxylesterase
VTAHEITTSDGMRLAARWWSPRGDGVDGRAAVVVVHGFCGSKDEPAVELVALRQVAAGRHVLTFDLRGHGRSEGETTLGLREGLDVDAAVADARTVADTVVVVGSSMGGVACIEHLAGTAEPGSGARASGAEVRRVAGAAGRADAGVLVATPARWQVPRTARGVLALALTQTRPGRAVAQRHMGTRVAVRPGRGHEPTRRIGEVATPVAVIHGLDDRFVSPAAARSLHGAVPGPRLLDLVAGMGHGFCGPATEPVDAAVDWALAQVAVSRFESGTTPA